MMTLEQALARRVSRRSYLAGPLTEAQKARLSEIMARAAPAGARIALVENGGQAFRRFHKSYGMFSGVANFFALVGRADDPWAEERLGYYGELLVLEACALGLGTCWVGGSRAPDACPCALAAGEALFGVIAVGPCTPKPGAKEAAVYHFIHRGTKDLEALYSAQTPVPAWFLEGMQAVRRAPSAYNRQPVRFRYADHTAFASVPVPARYHGLDLGIAKAHFALVAGGSWEWGDGGRFDKQGRGQYGLALPEAVDALLRLQRPDPTRSGGASSAVTPQRA